MVKLIHFLNKSTFDSKLSELSPDSIAFIKDTHEIWTHGLLYHCPLSLEEINALLEGKADIADLSNVLAEEAIDEPLLSEINTLTREEIKKDLFIDMWNEACKMRSYPDSNQYTSCGKYNSETGFFELNGITDITYEEALMIFKINGTNHTISKNSDYKYAGVPVRTLFPIRNLSSGFATSISANSMFYQCVNLEVITVGGHYGVINDWLILNAYNQIFGYCDKLRKIHANVRLDGNQTFEIWSPLLEELFIVNLGVNVYTGNSPLWNYESIRHTVEAKNNTTAITITVHPNVYAKITGDTTNDAYNSLTEEEKTAWMQLLTDAQAKQITFATA